MENNERVIARVDKASFAVIGKVSKAGKRYTVVSIDINGNSAQFFLTPDIELALLHAGVKFTY